MPTRLMINVKNRTSSMQNFYFFQQPAVFSGGQTVYSNNLHSQALGSYDQTGSILTFQVDAQPYAAIQQAHTQPVIGQASGYATATRAIDLTGGGAARNATTASLGPLGLSQPVNAGGVQPGAFRIITPTFQQPEIYNIGSGVEVFGRIAPSSFVVAQPNNNTDIQPQLKFYVQTGHFTPGAVMNFSSSSVNAAVCDFTGGHAAMEVTYNPDGSWSVQRVG